LIRWFLGFTTLLVLSLIPIQDVYAQEVVIPVNQTVPCFLNYSAGLDLWENCGADEDYLDFALMSWEWVTGGYFSMILVSLFITTTYIKYHKAAYPILIGVMFLPVSFFLFPEVFITWGIILTIFAAGIFIWYAFIRQTRE
jgi:hypothetical protein